MDCSKNLKINYLILLLLIFSVETVCSQIVIGKPNLGFSQACANEGFNSFNASFIFSPESNLEPTNQFTIELSNADGDFSNAIIVATSGAGEITVSPGNMSFSLPLDTAGENYKIRVKSSAPTATSTSSDPFAAYYKPQDSPFTINNLVDSAAFCAGGSYLLTIDNPGSGNNDSPLNYSGLTFNWYKETSPTTSVFVAEGPTLDVSVEGTYFVETNYGSCTSDSFSNRVTVIEVSSGESEAGISSSLGNPFCPDVGATTLSTIGAESYQWFKDGVIIEDATEQQYQTSEPGLYSVQVDLGECSANGSIQLETELFNAQINVDEYNTLEEGQTLWVFITQDANQPIFEWYFNDFLVSEITGDSYEVSELGNYKVVVTETSGCEGSIEFEFNVIDPFPDVPKIPNVISPNNDGINDTWVIPTKYVDGTNAEIMILSNRGELIFQTNEYLNDWPQDISALNGKSQVFYYMIKTNNEIKKGSITVVR